MKRPTVRDAISELKEVLSLVEVTGPPDEYEVGEGPPGIAFALNASRFKFFVAWSRQGDAVSVSRAIESLRKFQSRPWSKVIPTVAVPFMGETGQRLCQQASMAWYDLSGNVVIHHPSLVIMAMGRPNRYRDRGRPANVFAPKSSRLTRWLLIHPDRAFSQREISRATGLDEGYTSRIVKRLESEELIVRDASGGLMPRDYDLLLDAWHERYDFLKHDVMKGHVAARSGEELIERLDTGLAPLVQQCAATGLAGAWILSRHARFRTATYYLSEDPGRRALERIGFEEETRGANTWLVIPNDIGVFHGASSRHGPSCVHPVQAFLDLKSHPERSQEAAARLRHDHLSWSGDG
jgi:hypothetical protein